MKLKLLLAGAAVSTMLALPAHAQTVERQVVEEADAVGARWITSDAKSNWFISAGAGPQVFFGDHDKQRKFGQRISPALDISVGKWITPVIGLRLMYSGLYFKGATQDENGHNGPFSNGKPISGKPWNGYWLTESKVDFMNLHVDVMFDLVNWIGGYNPNRVYGLALYAGAGYGRTWNRPHNDAITADVGLFHMFHIGRAWDINIDMRLTAFDDGFDGQRGHRVFDGMTTLAAGVTYRFAPRGWKTAREVVTVYDNDAVNRLREEVAGLVAENERLERDAKGKTVTHKTVEFVGGDYIVYFPINVSSLSLADRVQLEMAAKSIKEAPKGTKYNVIGYADKGTGTPEINEILSRARAESVRECLVNEFGVNPSSLQISWKGGVSNMFYNDPELSRVVIISPAN